MRRLLPVVVAVVGGIYVGVQMLLFQRSVGESVLQAAVLLGLISLAQFFFFSPTWVRSPNGPVELASVVRVSTTGSGQQAVVLRGGEATVRAVLPRGTSGFRAGDTAYVSPRLEYARAFGLVVPGHVTSPRRVVTVSGGAA